MHLILDGVATNLGLITQVAELKDWLSAAVEAIGMTVIDGPGVINFPGQPPGLSGVVILAESSITVHTFPETNVVMVDIFSCKDYDVDKAIQMVRDTFRLVEYGVKVVRRPLDMSRLVPTWR